MTNRTKSTLYTGSTRDIVSRVKDHKSKFYPNAFSAQYQTNRLVFRRHFLSYEEAFDFEFYIKGKRRSWKIKLIESENPDWKDLSEEMKDW